MDLGRASEAYTTRLPSSLPQQSSVARCPTIVFSAAPVPRHQFAYEAVPVLVLLGGQHPINILSPIQTSAFRRRRYSPDLVANVPAGT
jgi:hypothetical protein